MRTMRIALATILIIGFIGIIPRSWSWADSHTETPAASESTNNMSSEEKCKEENYKRFEQCMIPCHKDNREENYYKALKLYEKPTTFEGTDIVFGYCMKICHEKIDRIDCSTPDERDMTDDLSITQEVDWLFIKFNTKEVKVQNGSLIAKSQNADALYIVPNNLTEIKKMLRDIISIETAHAYLERVHQDFPRYQKSNYFSKNVEEQRERAWGREWSELLDLRNYFGTLNDHLYNARIGMRIAIGKEEDDEGIDTLIQEAQREFHERLSETQQKIRDEFRHINLESELTRYRMQRHKKDHTTELIGQVQKK